MRIMEDTQSSAAKGIILVPVDYSEYSTKACRFAAMVAEKSGDTIHLLHTFYTPAFDLIELTGSLNTQQQLRAEVSEQYIDDEKKSMTDYIESLNNLAEFKRLKKNTIDFSISPGIAKDEILKTSEAIQPVMVVMGTRSQDKKNTSILGSTTESSIKKLKVPVITIPENYQFNSEKQLQNLIYLTDYDESDFASIKKLMRFTSIFNITIHCVHIGTKSDHWDSIKMDGLKEYFQKVYAHDAVVCHVLMKDPDTLHALDNYSLENNIDLIALTHLKRNVLNKLLKPSLTTKIFHHSNLPLLVFHG